MNFKRLLLLLIAVLVAFSMTACSGTKDSEPDKEDDNQNTGDKNQDNKGDDGKDDGKDDGEDDLEEGFHRVKFEWEGIPDQIIEDGERAVPPDIPSRDYYTFGGWLLDGEPWLFSTPITDSITLVPDWRADVFNITYFEGEVVLDITPSTYPADTEGFDLPIPSGKKHYTFDGWYLDKELTEQVTRIERGSVGNMTFYAKFTPIAYTITYELDGGTNDSFNPQTYTAPDSFRLLAAEKQGYEFVGWYTTSTFDDGTEITSITNATRESFTVYAKFEPKKYSITYQLDGGTNSKDNPGEYTVLDSEFEFYSPTKDGYKFMGWFTNSSFTTGITTLEGKTGNLTLYAKWTQESGGNIVTPEDPF